MNTPHTYTVTIEVAVRDERQLFDAALEHAIGVDHQTAQGALEYLKPDGVIDVDACLITLLDPGSMWESGCEIENSSVA